MSKTFSFAVLIALAVSVVAGCGGKGRFVIPEPPVIPIGSGNHKLPDTLTVGTLYSPTSFFILKDDTLGYDYERVRRFARDKHIGLRFVVASSMKQLIEFIDSSKVDIAAFEIPETAEFKQHVINCGPPNITYQVLVQPPGNDSISNVTQLIDREVYVIHGSSHEARLINLDSEIGGGIRIRAVNNDSLISEDLVDMVATGKLPLTIADSDIAQISKTYNEEINTSVRVGFAQRSSWAVGKKSQWLADTINAWSEQSETQSMMRDVRQRYFERNKTRIDSLRLAHFADSAAFAGKYVRKDGYISPYDSLFRYYAPLARVHWTMLASICYVESKFNATAVSWAGAQGIMQIMPSTARGYGYSEEDLFDPDKNVHLSALIIANTEKYLSSYISNRGERMRFVLASYNCGTGHVLDAIALAKKYGKNPNVWYGNVEEALLWKTNPEYYNDPVCRFGYCRGRETVNYVRHVEAAYSALAKYRK